MSAKNLQPRNKDNDEQNSTQNAMAARRARASSLGSQPALNMSLQRCNSAKPFYACETRRHVRSQSESSCSFETLRRSSSFQELCNNSSTQDERKFPKISPRVQSDDLMKIAPGTQKMRQRKSSCVLPDLSRRQDDTSLRVIPLRQQHVEKINNNFDSLKSKSLNLAKWLQDQP